VGSGLNISIYDFSPKELPYILNSKDEYGPNFFGETFRILKEREFG
jgi:hypothetical protein